MASTALRRKEATAVNNPNRHSTLPQQRSNSPKCPTRKALRLEIGCWSAFATAEVADLVQMLRCQIDRLQSALVAARAITATFDPLSEEAVEAGNLALLDRIEDAEEIYWERTEEPFAIGMQIVARLLQSPDGRDALTALGYVADFNQSADVSPADVLETIIAAKPSSQ